MPEQSRAQHDRLQRSEQINKHSKSGYDSRSTAWERHMQFILDVTLVYMRSNLWYLHAENFIAVTSLSMVTSAVFRNLPLLLVEKMKQHESIYCHLLDQLSSSYTTWVHNLVHSGWSILLLYHILVWVLIIIIPYINIFTSPDIAINHIQFVCLL